MLANAVDALNAGIDALGEFDWAGMPVRERMAAAEAMETAARRLGRLGYRVCVAGLRDHRGAGGSPAQRDR